MASPPPIVLFTFVSSFLATQSCLPASDPLEDRREAHAGADAHRDHSVFELRVALHGAYQRRDADGASGTEWMAQGDGTSERIDLCRIEVERAQASNGLSRESFVELDPVEIVLLDPGELERPRDGFDRPDAHDFRRYAGDAVGHEAGQRFEIVLLQNLFAYEDGGARAIGHLRGVASGDAALGGEHRPQLGKRFRADLRAWPFIYVDNHLGDFHRSGSRVG